MQISEVTRRISIEGTTKGIAEAASQLNRLTDAHGNVVAASERQEKASLAVDRAFEKQQRSLDLNYRMTKQYEQTLRDLERAHAQGLTTIGRHNDLLNMAAQRYNQVSRGQAALSLATQDVQNRIAATSGAAGVLASVLGALGPVGGGAALGMGMMALAFHAASLGAHELAEKSQELRRFSEVTGLTTDQVQALRSEASKFGVTSEEAQTAIQNFTTRFNDLRHGQGEMLKQILPVNAALAAQMAGVTSSSAAITLFGRALQATDNIFDRNALVKAATGKGGLGTVQFFTGLNVDQVTASAVTLGKVIDKNLIEKLSQSEIEFNKSSSKIKQNLSLMFAEDILEGANRFLGVILKITDATKTWRPLGSPFPTLGDIAPGVDISRLSARAPTRGLPAADAALRFTPAPAPLPEFDLEHQRRVNEALGTAATITEQYRLKFDQLNITAKGGKLTTEQYGRALEGLRLDEAIAKTSLLASALGVMAPVQLAVDAATQRVNKANQQGAGITAAQAAGLRDLARDQALGTAALKSQTDSAGVQAATLNMAAGAAAAYTAKQNLLNDATRNHKKWTSEDSAEIDKQARALGDATGALEKARVASQISFDRQTVLLGPEDVAIAQQLRGIYGTDIPAALRSSEAEAIRLTNAQKALVQSINSALSSGMNTFIDSLRAGKSLTDSMTLSMRSMSQSLQSSAITSLLQGNFLAAGVQGVGALVTGLFGSRQTSEERLAAIQQQTQENAARVNAMAQFTLRQRQATADQNTLEGQLAVFDTQADIQRIQAAQDTSANIAALEQTLAMERQKIVGDYNAKVAEADAQAAADRLAKVQDFSRQLNDAAGKGYLNDVADLIKSVSDFQSAGVAPDLLSSFFGLSAQKIVDAAGLAGSELTDLTNVFPQLAGRVHDATSAIEAQAAAQAKLNAAAKTIVDYVNGLSAGAESTLSPQDRLAAASGTYGSQLALAAAGNTDAQAGITKYAEDFRAAARAMYGSTGAYQAIEAQIKAQLLALPAVTGTNDPVVLALRDVQAAVITNNNLVTAGNALETAQNSLVSTQNALTTSANAILTAAQSLLNSINGLQGTAADQLRLLTGQLTGGSVTLVTSGTVIGSSNSASIDNNMITALNKIVINTQRIATNTAHYPDNYPVHSDGTGVLAAGGWIRGGVPDRDSVRLASGDLGMPGEFVLRKQIAQANAAWLPEFNRSGRLPPVRPVSPAAFGPAGNDNGDMRAVMAELRALRAEVAALRRDQRASLGLVADAVKDGAEGIAAAKAHGTRKAAETARLEGRRAGIGG